MTTILLTSCTPDTLVTTNTNNGAICSQPKLQFKGNGTLFVCDAIPDSRFGWAGYPFLINTSATNGRLTFINYKKSAYSSSPIWLVNFPVTQNKVSGDFTFNTIGNTPNIGNYSTIEIGMSFNNDTYRYENVPNSIVLNITSIANGLVSGTFNGVIPAVNNGVSNGPQMNITEGVFSNIPLFQ